MLSSDELTVVRYGPDSLVSSPGRLVKSMWRELVDSQELSRRLFRRDLSAQYRQSLLGVLWAFVPPIMTSAIFIYLQSRNVINLGDTDIPYPVFVIVGTLLWQMFSESLNAPLKSVTAAKPLLAKINFPRISLIISAFYLTLFNSGIKLLVLVGVFLIFRMPLTWGLLLSPVAILMLILLGLALGLFLTPFGMLYTDVATMLPILLSLLFFLTPVVYPPPTAFPLSILSVLNPISPLLIASRDLITMGTITNVIPFTVVSGLTIIGLLVAWVIYHVALPVIIERMSA